MPLISWNDWLAFASVLVILGVILEGYELLVEIKVKKSWLPIWTKLGFSLLVIGLGLEFVFQSKVQSADAELKRRSDVTIGTLTKETRVAEGKIADAQRDVANAKLDAENARLEQERIKSLVIWRTLSPSQANVLQHGLESGKASVTISWIANDPESLFLASQIVRLFAEVNVQTHDAWHVEFDSRSYSHTLVFDVHIPPPENSATMLIRSAFKAANIPFSTQDVPVASFQLNSMIANGSLPTTDAFIMIGSKRPPL